MSTDADIQIRWMIRRDWPEAMRIEQLSFPDPWNEDDFAFCVAQRNAIAMLAEYRGRTAGLMIYELRKNSLAVQRLAVHPDYRMRGVGREFVWKLRSKLTQQRRTEWCIYVRETNLDGQKFLRACGVGAVCVERNWFSHPEEDAFLFRHSIGKPARAVEFDADPDDDRCAGVG